MAVRIGLEVLLDEYLHLIRGSRVGLIASASSVDSQLVSSVERLYQCKEIRLVALFGPEHGIRGDMQAGDHVAASVDKVTGLPVYSLYGETRKPTAEMLQDVDVLIFDLQDGGVRFYTYLSTLVYAMQASTEYGFRIVTLDRPNAITGKILEGGILNPNFSSFVGLLPIPLRHGLTAGEVAHYINETFHINCNLTTIPMKGWRRSLWFDETGLPFIPPSPNIPTLSTLTVYPGTCLIEGTNLPEGRGTTKPFEYIGAPWLDAEALATAMHKRQLPGVRFRPVYFTPTFNKYAHQQCAGVHIYVTDRDKFRPVEMTIHLLSEIIQHYPNQFAFNPPHHTGTYPHFDLLAGSNKLREHLISGKPISEILSQWENELEKFSADRAPFLLYED